MILVLNSSINILFYKLRGKTLLKYDISSKTNNSFVYNKVVNNHI